MKTTEKTISIYNLAFLIMDYNGKNTKPENVHAFAKTVAKHSEMYIRIAQDRNLI